MTRYLYLLFCILIGYKIDRTCNKREIPFILGFPFFIIIISIVGVAIKGYRDIL